MCQSYKKHLDNANLVCYIQRIVVSC